MSDKPIKRNTVEITVKDVSERGPAPVRKDEDADVTTLIAAGAPLHTGRVMTRLHIYILETGSEPLGHGTQVEIRGSVRTFGTVPSDNPISIDLPEHSIFKSENNGLGKLIWVREFHTFHLPLDFQAYIYEEGGAGTTKKILSRAVNFAERPNAWQWGFWWWYDDSPQDPNFKAYVAWTIEDAPEPS
jgi:hypothetical protein